MRSWNYFASALLACSLIVGPGGFAAKAHAASAGQSAMKSGAKNDVIKIKDRGRRPLPIAPSYRAYDWPYYFRRGHYPTHIGPGYVFSGYPYTYRANRNPSYAGHCSYWPAKSVRRAWIDARKCVGR